MVKNTAIKSKFVPMWGKQNQAPAGETKKAKTHKMTSSRQKQEDSFAKAQNKSTLNHEEASQTAQRG